VAVNGHTIIVAYCCGGAALAAWLLVRYPSAGPQRLVSLVVALLAVVAGFPLAAALFDAVANLGRYGVAMGLIFVVFPMLTAAFWTSGCVMRALASGGMSGLRP
jgi:hypothetical protein